MTADLPPTVDVQPASANTLSQADADAVLAKLASELKGTRFTAAWPAALPGFVAVQLANGQVAYTDKNARYFIMGLVFDTTSGAALDHQMEGSH